MDYKYTTHVPNELFDKHLPHLTFAELKILLIIIRQTQGWVDTKTGKRKVRDRISRTMFMAKTNLSRRVISHTIQSLISKELITVTDYTGAELPAPDERKGQFLYYSLYSSIQGHLGAHTRALPLPTPGHPVNHIKRKNKKENKTKETVQSIGNILEKMYKKYFHKK
ncbi:MAG: hypothetical protein POELPBGB_01370 [Bacteroidia bacterium]|nr:hypothetical protein [Bacteroidia bacterium]